MSLVGLHSFFGNLISAQTISPVEPGSFGNFWSIIGMLLMSLLQGICSIFYVVCKWFLAVVDFLQYFVQKLIGLDYWLNSEPKSIDGAIDGDLLFSFLFNDTVQNVFRAMVGIFFILLIVFTIFAIIKQEWTFATSGFEGGNEGNSKIPIFRSALKAFAMVAIFPLIMVIGIISSNAVLASLVKALNIDMSQTFGGTLFSISAQSANRYRVYADNGQRSPVSQKITFAVNQDGKTIAYSDGSMGSEEYIEYYSTHTQFMQNYYASTSKEYTVNTIFPLVDPGDTGWFKGDFTGYCVGLNVGGSRRYFMVKCSSGESEGMFYYLRNILGAKIIYRSADKNKAQGITSDDAYDGLYSTLKRKIKSGGNGAYIKGINLSSYSDSTEVIKACYNTWYYSSVYKTAEDFITAEEYNLIGTDITSNYGFTGMNNVKVMFNSNQISPYFDGGQFGVVQKQSEYLVMADVVDYMNNTGATLYMMDVTSTMIKWDYAGHEADSKYISQFRTYTPENSKYTVGGTKYGESVLPFIVEYSESCNDIEAGKVLYLPKYNKSSELEGSIYVMCWKVQDGSTTKYVPLIHGKSFTDSLTGKTYESFKSDFLSNNYHGLVIAKGIFETDSTNAGLGEPTYIKTSMSVEGSKLGDFLEGASNLFNDGAVNPDDMYYYEMQQVGQMIEYVDESTTAMLERNYKVLGVELYYGEGEEVDSNIEFICHRRAADSDDMIWLMFNTETNEYQNFDEYELFNIQLKLSYVDANSQTRTVTAIADGSAVMGSEYGNTRAETYSTTFVTSEGYYFVGQHGSRSEMTIDGKEYQGFRFFGLSASGNNDYTATVDYTGVGLYDGSGASGAYTGELKTVTQPYDIYFKYENGSKSVERKILTAYAHEFEHLNKIGDYSRFKYYELINTGKIELDMNNDNDYNDPTDIVIDDVRTEFFVHFDTKFQNLLDFDGSVIDPDNPATTDVGPEIIKFIKPINSTNAINTSAYMDYTVCHYQFKLYDFYTGAVENGSYVTGSDPYIMRKYDVGTNDLVKDGNNYKKISPSVTFDCMLNMENFEWKLNYTEKHLYNGDSYVVTIYKHEDTEIVADASDTTGVGVVEQLSWNSTKILYNYKEFYNVLNQNYFTSEADMVSHYSAIKDALIVGFYRDNAGGIVGTGTWFKNLIQTDINFNLFGSWRFHVMLAPQPMTHANLAGYFTLEDGVSFDYFFDRTKVQELDKEGVGLGTFFMPSKISYWILLIASAMIIKVLGQALWGVIKRFYEITLYYIAMPPVAATIPLDNGERFKVSITTPMLEKVLGTYGVMLGLNVFFVLLAPVKSMSNIFTEADIATSGLYFLQKLPIGPKLLNGYVYIMFVLVAFTLIESLPGVITRIIGVDKNGNSDVFTSGGATKEASKKTLQSAGDIISGRALQQGVAETGEAVGGFIPGSGIFKGIFKKSKDFGAEQPSEGGGSSNGGQGRETGSENDPDDPTTPNLGVTDVNGDDDDDANARDVSADPMNSNPVNVSAQNASGNNPVTGGGGDGGGGGGGNGAPIVARSNPSAAGGLLGALDNLAGAVVNVAATAVNAGSAAMATGVQVGLDVVQNVGEGVAEGTKEVIKSTGKAAGKVVEKTVDVAGQAVEKAVDVAGKVAEKTVDVAANAANTVVNTAGNVVTNTANAVTQLPAQVLNTLSDGELAQQDDDKKDENKGDKSTENASGKKDEKKGDTSTEKKDEKKGDESTETGEKKQTEPNAAEQPGYVKVDPTAENTNNNNDDNNDDEESQEPSSFLESLEEKFENGDYLGAIGECFKHPKQAFQAAMGAIKEAKGVSDDDADVKDLEGSAENGDTEGFLKNAFKHPGKALKAIFNRADKDKETYDPNDDEANAAVLQDVAEKFENGDYLGAIGTALKNPFKLVKSALKGLREADPENKDFKELDQRVGEGNYFGAIKYGFAHIGSIFGGLKKALPSVGSATASEDPMERNVGNASTGEKKDEKKGETPTTETTGEKKGETPTTENATDGKKENPTPPADNSGKTTEQLLEEATTTIENNKKPEPKPETTDDNQDDENDEGESEDEEIPDQAEWTKNRLKEVNAEIDTHLYAGDDGKKLDVDASISKYEDDLTKEEANRKAWIDAAKQKGIKVDKDFDFSDPANKETIDKMIAAGIFTQDELDKSNEFMKSTSTHLDALKSLKDEKADLELKDEINGMSDAELDAELGNIEGKETFKKILKVAGAAALGVGAAALLTTGVGSLITVGLGVAAFKNQDKLKELAKKAFSTPQNTLKSIAAIGGIALATAVPGLGLVAGAGLGVYGYLNKDKIVKRIDSMKNKQIANQVSPMTIPKKPEPKPVQADNATNAQNAQNAKKSDKVDEAAEAENAKRAEHEKSIADEKAKREAWTAALKEKGVEVGEDFDWNNEDNLKKMQEAGINVDEVKASNAKIATAEAGIKEIDEAAEARKAKQAEEAENANTAGQAETAETSEKAKEDKDAEAQQNLLDLIKQLEARIATLEQQLAQKREDLADPNLSKEEKEKLGKEVRETEDSIDDLEEAKQGLEEIADENQPKEVKKVGKGWKIAGLVSLGLIANSIIPGAGLAMAAGATIGTIVKNKQVKPAGQESSGVGKVLKTAGLVSLGLVANSIIPGAGLAMAAGATVGVLVKNKQVKRPNTDNENLVTATTATPMIPKKKPVQADNATNAQNAQNAKKSDKVDEAAEAENAKRAEHEKSIADEKAKREAWTAALKEKGVEVGEDFDWNNEDNLKKMQEAGINVDEVKASNAKIATAEAGIKEIDEAAEARKAKQAEEAENANTAGQAETAETSEKKPEDAYVATTGTKPTFTPKPEEKPKKTKDGWVTVSTASPEYALQKGKGANQPKEVKKGGKGWKIAGLVSLGLLANTLVPGAGAVMAGGAIAVAGMKKSGLGKKLAQFAGGKIFKAVKTAALIGAGFILPGGFATVAAGVLVAKGVKKVVKNKGTIGEKFKGTMTSVGKGLLSVGKYAGLAALTVASFTTPGVGLLTAGVVAGMLVNRKRKVTRTTEAGKNHFKDNAYTAVSTMPKPKKKPSTAGSALKEDGNISVFEEAYDPSKGAPRTAGQAINAVRNGHVSAEEAVDLVAEADFNRRAIDDEDYVDDRQAAMANVVKNRHDSRIGREIRNEAFSTYGHGETQAQKIKSAIVGDDEHDGLMTAEMGYDAIRSTLKGSELEEFNSLDYDGIYRFIQEKGIEVETNVDDNGDVSMKVNRKNGSSVDVDKETINKLISQMLTILGNPAIMEAMKKTGTEENVALALSNNLALGVDYNAELPSNATSKMSQAVFAKAGDDDNLMAEAFFRYVANNQDNDVLQADFAEQFHVDSIDDLQDATKRHEAIEQFKTYINSDSSNIVTDTLPESYESELAEVAKERAVNGEFRFDAWNDMTSDEEQAEFKGRTLTKLQNLAEGNAPLSIAMTPDEIGKEHELSVAAAQNDMSALYNAAISSGSIDSAYIEDYFASVTGVGDASSEGYKSALASINSKFAAEDIEKFTHDKGLSEQDLVSAFKKAELSGQEVGKLDDLLAFNKPADASLLEAMKKLNGEGEHSIEEGFIASLPEPERNKLIEAAANGKDGKSYLANQLNGDAAQVLATVQGELATDKKVEAILEAQGDLIDPARMKKHIDTSGNKDVLENIGFEYYKHNTDSVLSAEEQQDVERSARMRVINSSGENIEVTADVEKTHLYGLMNQNSEVQGMIASHKNTKEYKEISSKEGFDEQAYILQKMEEILAKKMPELLEKLKKNAHDDAVIAATRTQGTGWLRYTMEESASDSVQLETMKKLVEKLKAESYLESSMQIDGEDAYRMSDYARAIAQGMSTDDFTSLYTQLKHDNDGKEPEMFTDIRRDIIRGQVDGVTMPEHETPASQLNYIQNLIRQMSRNGGDADLLANAFRNANLIDMNKHVEGAFKLANNGKGLPADADMQTIKNGLTNEQINAYLKTQEALKNNLVAQVAGNVMLGFDQETGAMREIEALLGNSALRNDVGVAMLNSELNAGQINNELKKFMMANPDQYKSVTDKLNSGDESLRQQALEYISQNRKELEAKLAQSRYFETDSKGNTKLKSTTDMGKVSEAIHAKSAESATFSKALYAEITKSLSGEKPDPDFFKNIVAQASVQTVEEAPAATGPQSVNESLTALNDALKKGLPVNNSEIGFAKQLAKNPEESVAYNNWNAEINRKIDLARNASGEYEGLSKGKRDAEIVRLKGQIIDTSLPKDFASWGAEQQAAYTASQNDLKTKAIKTGNFSGISKQTDSAIPVAGSTDAKTVAASTGGKVLTYPHETSAEAKNEHQISFDEISALVKRYMETEPIRNKSESFGKGFKTFAESYVGSERAAHVVSKTNEEFVASMKGQKDKNGNNIGANFKIDNLTPAQVEALIEQRMKTFEAVLRKMHFAAAERVGNDATPGSYFARMGEQTPIQVKPTHFNTNESHANANIKPETPKPTQTSVIELQRQYNAFNEMNANFSGNGRQYAATAQQTLGEPVTDLYDRYKKKYGLDLAASSKSVQQNEINKQFEHKQTKIEKHAQFPNSRVVPTSRDSSSEYLSGTLKAPAKTNPTLERAKQLGGVAIDKNRKTTESVLSEVMTPSERVTYTTINNDHQYAKQRFEAADKKYQEVIKKYESVPVKTTEMKKEIESVERERTVYKNMLERVETRKENFESTIVNREVQKTESVSKEMSVVTKQEREFYDEKGKPITDPKVAKQGNDALRKFVSEHIDHMTRLRQYLENLVQKKIIDSHSKLYTDLKSMMNKMVQENRDISKEVKRYTKQLQNEIDKLGDEVGTVKNDLSTHAQRISSSTAAFDKKISKLGIASSKVVTPAPTLPKK